jgi:type I restriction enzyme S subunit
MSDLALPNGWQIVALSELLTEQSNLTYGVVQPGQATPGGVPIVRVKDIRNGRIATDDLLLISSDIEDQYQRSRIRGGELLVTLVGTVGETAIASDEQRGWNTARAVATVRLPTPEYANWVRYCIQSPEGQERIRSRVNTTVQTTLNLKDLREFPVLLPPLNERQAIAGILGVLDEKIESNRRLVEISLDLISTKFANEESLSMNRTSLSRLLNLERGREPGRDLCREDGVGTPFIRVSNLKMEKHRGLTLEDFEGPLATPEDVLISFDGTPGRVAFGLMGYFSSGVRRALPVGRPIPTSLTWAILAGESVQGVISEYATGTTIQHAGSALPHLTAPLLSTSGFSWFENAGENLWRSILGLRRSSETLFSLRTSLSVEMLSGRLRVKDAESMMENV